MPGISYVTAASEKELLQILGLQQANLREQLTEEEIRSEGFVTVSHSLEQLRAMNQKCPHILAKADGKVVGYALCMHPDFRNEITILKPMFAEIDASLSSDKGYIIMGQICIARAYRRKGIFRGLYRQMKESTQEQYPYIITEVDSANLRSLEAHYAVGFQDLKQYSSGRQDWHLLVLK